MNIRENCGLGNRYSKCFNDILQGKNLAFFNDDERATLSIKSMILHVVGTETFTPEAARSVEHETFFLSRLLDLDATPVYSFNKGSRTKETLEDMAKANVTFETGAQTLSREFSKQHVGASRDGALFVFELGNDDPNFRIYSLIKYDYSEAIEQTNTNGESLLRKIVTAFIADRKAIQKAAIIRVRDGLAEEAIATRDRAKPQPDIGDYFAIFLDVTRTLSDAELTERAKNTVREALGEMKDLLSSTPAKAYSRALTILRDRTQLDEESIIEALVAAAKDPLGEDERLKIRAVALRKLKSKKLIGVAFKPDKATLGRSALHRVRTIENITITYPEQMASSNIQRLIIDGGGEMITIRTQKITEEEIVAT